jgi:hypothetical protein
MRRLVLLLLLLSMAPFALSAEPPVGEKRTDIDDVLSQADRQSVERSLIPQAACTEFEDQVTREQCWQAFRSYFQYYQSGFGHRRAVFGWQHLSTRIIFVVVLLLVTAGIYFAWVQFRHDLIVSKDRPKGEAAPTHNVEIGTTGVKVSSPVLGVIILTLSLAFFYLYLVHVYPIAEIL